MKTYLRFLLTLCVSLYVAPSAAWAGILFRDNFTVSSESVDVNLGYNTGGRQSGTLAPAMYTKTGFAPWSQVGNGGSPGALLLAGGLGDVGMVSPNVNFNVGAGTGGYQVIRLAVDPVSAGSSVSALQGSWTAISFGKDSQNSFVNTATGFGILFRGNGLYQSFDGGTYVGGGSYATRVAGTFVPIEIRVIDPTDGNAFNGSGGGITIQAYANGSLVFSYNRPGNFANNYITLIGESDDGNLVVHYVDNFEVSTAERPAVTSANPTGVTSYAATLNGTVNPKGGSTSAWFEWGLTTSYGNTTPTQAMGEGTSAQPFIANLAGLTPGITYHYRAVAQNAVTMAYGNDMTFTTLTPYQAWAAASGVAGGNSGPSDDFDSDGMINQVEWAFGTNPTMTTSGVIEVSGGTITQRGTPTLRVQNIPNGVDFRAVFGRRKNHSAAGLTYTVEFSGDLISWQSSTTTPSVIADDGEIEAVTVPYPFFVNGKKARFFRVSVSISP